MIPVLSIWLAQIDIPAPPVPGGDVVTEWWRIIALIVVSVLTTGILALIFRPSVPIPAGEGADLAETPRLSTVPPNVAPLRRTTDQPVTPTVIPFPGRDRIEATPPMEQSARAATERLRRITEQTAVKPDAPGTRTSGPETLGSGTTARARSFETADQGENTNVVANELAQESGDEDEMAGTPDSWDLLGELSERLPSVADSSGVGEHGTFQPDDLDLLGDLVNRSPSIMDRANSGTISGSDSVAGLPPSTDEIDRLLAQVPSGKIVQFVPRPAPPATPEIDPAYELLNDIHAQPDSVITQFPVDLNTREQVTATVQELLFCANVGEFIHGFALYTDKFLFAFMDQSGMNEDEFRERFSSIPARDPSEWTRIESIREFRRLDDGRIAALVQYAGDGQPGGRERYVFKQDPQTERWMIDDISPAV